MREELPEPKVRELNLRFKNLNEIKMVVDQIDKKTKPRYMYIYDGYTYFKIELEKDEKIGNQMEGIEAGSEIIHGGRFIV